jgi:hypothetical protein
VLPSVGPQAARRLRGQEPGRSRPAQQLLGAAQGQAAVVKQEGWRVGLGLGRPGNRQDRPQLVQDVAQHRSHKDVREADALSPEPEDPVDLPAGDPHAEASARIGDRRGDLLAAAEQRQEPAPRPAVRKVAEEAAVGVLHVHGGPRHRVLHAGRHSRACPVPTGTSCPPLLPPEPRWPARALSDRGGGAAGPRAGAGRWPGSRLAGAGEGGLPCRRPPTLRFR